MPNSAEIWRRLFAAMATTSSDVRAMVIRHTLCGIQNELEKHEYLKAVSALPLDILIGVSADILSREKSLIQAIETDRHDSTAIRAIPSMPGGPDDIPDTTYSFVSVNIPAKIRRRKRLQYEKLKKRDE